MGCGKSTIGKRLSTRCAFSFVDTDVLFSQIHNCSIKDYFDSHTEEEFREEETKILHQTQYMNNTVIALGGGTPCYKDNMQWILSNGVVVYIRMSDMALYSRLVNGKKERPLLCLPGQDLKNTIKGLLLQREEIYCKAHIVVSGIDFDMGGLLKQLESSFTIISPA